jgi:hypothetical protein
MKSFIIQIILLISLSYGAISQPFVDIVSIQNQAFGFNENTTSQFTSILSVPIPIKNGNYLLIGGSYDKLSFHENETFIPATDLTAITTQLGAIKKWNDSWSTTAVLIRKVSSDFEELSSKDYQLGGVGLMTKTVSEKLKYKFGLYYNNEFFGNFFIPLAGFELKVSDRVQIFGVLPRAMNFEYKISSKVYTGMKFSTKTTSYRLSESLNNQYIRENNVLLNGYINYYPLNKLIVYCEIGHTAFRRFKIFENDSKNKLGAMRGFKDNLALNIGTALRIRLDSE